MLIDHFILYWAPTLPSEYLTQMEKPGRTCTGSKFIKYHMKHKGLLPDAEDKPGPEWTFNDNLSTRALLLLPDFSLTLTRSILELNNGHFH